MVINPKRYVKCTEKRRKANKMLTRKSVGKRSPRMGVTVLLIFLVYHLKHFKFPMATELKMFEIADL